MFKVYTAVTAVSAVIGAFASKSLPFTVHLAVYEFSSYSVLAGTSGTTETVLPISTSSDLYTVPSAFIKSTMQVFAIDSVVAVVDTAVVVAAAVVVTIGTVMGEVTDTVVTCGVVEGVVYA